MRLRQEMTGKAAIDADALVQKALAGATAKAMQGVMVNTAGNLGHAVSLTMDTGQPLDFANKRWGIAGINYMSNLVAAGHPDAAAILPTLPTYSKSAVVAAKNMSGMALNEKGLNAQLQALAADLNNPFIMHNASARAMRQAAEARVADLTEAGALPQIAAAQKNVDSARQTALDAQAAYTKATRNYQGARAALMVAQAAFDQNPADTAAMDAVMDAIGSVGDANQAGAQAKLAYQSNQKVLTEAQTRLDDVQRKTLASVQAQVKQEIAELRREQEGAGAALAQRIISSRMMDGMVASAKADTKAGPGTGISSRADLPTSPNVSIAENNAGNEVAPLASVNGSSIIGEDAQGGNGIGRTGNTRKNGVVARTKAEAISKVMNLDIEKATIDKLKSAMGDYVDETIHLFMDKFGKSYKGNPLRVEYESKVNHLSDLAMDLRVEGKSAEEIAKTVSQTRRDLGEQYKLVTPPILREYIYELNISRYTDPLGPTFDFLMNRYARNYEMIIGAACRPNPDVDNLLGGFEKWLIGKSK